jgi:hypothetical protein
MRAAVIVTVKPSAWHINGAGVRFEKGVALKVGADVPERLAGVMVRLGYAKKSGLHSAELDAAPRRKARGARQED